MKSPLRSCFTDHPASVGQTYWQHCRFALGVGGRMLVAGLACVIHAIFPFLFKTTASKTIQDLHAYLERSK